MSQSFEDFLRDPRLPGAQNVDLSEAMIKWPYNPDELGVRVISGVDGILRIQMRIELGIAQMEVDGRPDGARPKGAESLLDYHLGRIDKYEEHHGHSVGFKLSPEECSELRSEASLYYRRYLCCFVLGRFDLVVRDTQHALDIFNLCREHGSKEEDRRALEQYRPYQIMMHTRGSVYLALSKSRVASALAHVRRGIAVLKTQPEELEERDLYLDVLRKLLVEITKSNSDHPVVKYGVVKTMLKKAVEREDFQTAEVLKQQPGKLREELRISSR